MVWNKFYINLKFLFYSIIYLICIIYIKEKAERTGKIISHINFEKMR